MSYAMARLKANEHYRSNDDRYFIPSALLRRHMGFKKGYVWPRTNEAELRATLSEGGENHKYVVQADIGCHYSE